jgi:RNA polymerase sigma-70 factor (ECF subfamily)
LDRSIPYIAKLTAVKPPMNMNPVDDALLRRIVNKDPEALREVIGVYFSTLCVFAERYLPDGSLAKDVVQETFIRLWQYESSFETIQGFEAFLFTVTRNGCLSLLRGRDREVKKIGRGVALTESDDDTVYDEIVRLEHLAQVNRVVQEMPEKMREVFRLSYIEGFTIDEIAQRMRISNKTVRNQRYNALVFLRERFRNSDYSFFLAVVLLLK